MQKFLIELPNICVVLQADGEMISSYRNGSETCHYIYSSKCK